MDSYRMAKLANKIARLATIVVKNTTDPGINKLEMRSLKYSKLGDISMK